MSKSSEQLHSLCERGEKEEVIELLSKSDNIDVNQKDQSNRYPIHYAAIGGFTEIVALLLDRGASVNCSTPRGATPLHYASRGGHIQCVKLLIENGADVNCKDHSGNTPLLTSLTYDEFKCAKALIEIYNADVQLTNSEGLTPLHMAVLRGSAEVIISLLEHNAKFDTRDPKGASAFSTLAFTEFNDKINLDKDTFLGDISKLFEINSNREFSSGSNDDEMKIDKDTDNNSNSNSNHINNNNNNNNKYYSDLEFILEDKKSIYSHKCIIFSRCPNLLKNVSNNTNKITIKESSYKSFLSFIEWVYTNNIESLKQNESSTALVDLSLAFSVLLLADKYDVKSLLAFVQEYIMKNVSESNVSSIWPEIKKLPLSTRKNIPILMRHCFVTMTKGWNIITNLKSFKEETTKNDVIEIIRTLEPYISANKNENSKPSRTTATTASTQVAAKTSTTPAKSSRNQAATTPSKAATTPSKAATPSTTPSKAAAPSTSSSSSSSYSEQMNEKNKNSCKTILSGISKKKISFAFLRPVDPVLENIPDYFDVIKHPMDISTINTKLENDKYGTIKDFAADVRLMFENALTYNAENSHVYKYAKQLLSNFDTQFIKTYPNEKIPTYKSLNPQQPSAVASSAGSTSNNINAGPSTSTPNKRKLESDHKIKEETSTATTSSSTNTEKSTIKKYSDDERKNLMEKINELDPDEVQAVLSIIDKSAINQSEESLEIDMYKIDDKNLQQVEQFLNDCFKKQRK